MTFLFKNKLMVLFLLPFVISSTLTKMRIKNLTASNNLTYGIDLRWEGDFVNDEIIEIQRSLHGKNDYKPLMLTDENKKKAAKDHIHLDNAGLQPKPNYYDYRISVFKNKEPISDWSNIAVGSLVPVALGTIQDTTHSKSIICTAALTLESAIQKKKGIYELRFKHEHDCNKEHSIQVFLSKDRKIDTDDLLLNIVEKQATTLKVQTQFDTKGYEFMILVIDNQLDVVKITPKRVTIADIVLFAGAQAAPTIIHRK
jgi:hypothetical protein